MDKQKLYERGMIKMNQPQIFNFENQEVRTVVVNDEPYFVGNDAAKILGYSNYKNAVAAHVDEEDKLSTRIKYAGQNRNVTIINESGVYSLIFGSKLPDAKRFKRWVTNEVLPSIRKHGAYATPQTMEQLISDPNFGIRLLEELQNERDKKEEAEQQLEKQMPQVTFAKSVEVSQNAVPVKALAGVLKQNGVDIGQNRLFQWLRDNKYLSSRPRAWNMPTQKSMNLKLFELKPNTFFHNDGVPETNYTTLVTGKGQVYFVNKFLNQGKLQEV